MAVWPEDCPTRNNSRCQRLDSQRICDAHPAPCLAPCRVVACRALPLALQLQLPSNRVGVPQRAFAVPVPALAHARAIEEGVCARARPTQATPTAACIGAAGARCSICTARDRRCAMAMASKAMATWGRASRGSVAARQPWGPVAMRQGGLWLCAGPQLAGGGCSECSEAVTRCVGSTSPRRGPLANQRLRRHCHPSPLPGHRRPRELAPSRTPVPCHVRAVSCPMRAMRPMRRCVSRRGCVVGCCFTSLWTG